MNYFGIRLRYLRLQDNLTQTDLGKALKIAKSTISMYESGKREPDFETVEKFADFFNVDMATFFPSGTAIEKTAVPKDNGLNTEELELISIYRSVNEDGRQYIVKQAKFAAEQKEFRLPPASAASAG